MAKCDNSDAEVLTRLQATLPEINEIMAICKAPSISFGVMHHGKIVFSSSLGLRDTARGLPANCDTSYPLGSCSKMLTSLALAILVEEGKIAWSDTVQKHLPSFNPVEDSEIGKKATIIDACRHSTGLANPNCAYLGPRGTLTVSGDEHIDLVNALPTSNASGQRFNNWWYYSNAAFGLMGLVIEAATNERFSTCLQERILKPLDLDQTLVTTENVKENDNIAYPSTQMSDGTWRAVENVATADTNSAVLAAMGIRTSVNDLLALFAAVMNCYDTDRGEASPQPLFNNCAHNPLRRVSDIWDHWWSRPIDDGFDNDSAYSLGWWRTTIPTIGLGYLSFNNARNAESQESYKKFIIGQDSAPRRLYGHSGIGNGYLATTYVCPSSHSAVVAFSNASDFGDAPEAVSQLLLQALFDLKPHVDLVLATRHWRDLHAQKHEKLVSEWELHRQASSYHGRPTDYVGTYIGLRVSRLTIVLSESAAAGVAVYFGPIESTVQDMEPYNDDVLSHQPLKHDEIIANGMLDWDWYGVGLFEFLRNDEGDVVALWWQWDQYDYPGLWVREREGSTLQHREAMMKKYGSFRKHKDKSSPSK